MPELKDGSFDGAAQTQGEIEFHDVSFAYPGSARNVLSHINLKIHRGESVAVVGATGCGKTTLAGLMMRIPARFMWTELMSGNTGSTRSGKK